LAQLDQDLVRLFRVQLRDFSAQGFTINEYGLRLEGLSEKR
jgi:hypothetical protein